MIGRTNTPTCPRVQYTEDGESFADALVRLLVAYEADGDREKFIRSVDLSHGSDVAARINAAFEDALG
jgi:hypothetical protein